MSYLARLKGEFSEKPLHSELTKPTKAPSVSFVSARSSSISENERDEPLAGLAALALANPPATKAMNQDEREIVAWLHRIGEPDPVVFGETLAKARTNPNFRAAFLSMARGDDSWPGANHHCESD